MNNSNISFLFVLVLVILVTSCKKESQFQATTIKKIENRDAVMKCSDFVKHIYFEEGIIIDSPTLLNTIYMLEPVNLPEQFNLHDLKVTVSGDILENPGYSSHSNYTKFYIRDIKKRNND
jgi:hypothetical protein